MTEISAALRAAPRIERCSALDERTIQGLAALLVDCVEGGASVGFMSPLTLDRAAHFWRGQADDVATGRRLLWIARDADGIVGTVQVVPAPQENQPHRADVAKLLVHSRARRGGVATELMRTAEAGALAAGRWLLMLDTVTSSPADRLYRRLGWTEVGPVADYALWPGGGYCSTTFFVRRLAEP